MPKSDFQAFIDRAFWALLCGVVALGVKFLADLAQTKDQLVLTQQRQDSDIRRHDEAIGDLRDIMRRMDRDRIIKGDTDALRPPRRP